MNISYEYYRIFYYAAKYLNFTAAAKAVQSNQPNVSRTIRLLEHELGCQLFLRSNRGIALTPEGEKLFSHVKIAVEQLQTAEEELQMVGALHSGLITVGTSETALHLLLLPVLTRFKKVYPNVRVRVRNHLTVQALESVTQGLVDFSLVASPISISPPLKASALMQFHDILIGGPDFFHLSKETVSLQDLKDCPLVSLGDHTMTYRFHEDFYRSNGLAFKPELEAATTDQLLAMVKANLGLGYLPEVFAQKALASGEVFRIFLPETIPSRQIYLAENEERPLSVTAGALKNMLIQFCSGHRT